MYQAPRTEVIVTETVYNRPMQMQMQPMQPMRQPMQPMMGQQMYPYGQPVVMDPYVTPGVVVVENRQPEIVYVDNYNNGAADAMAMCCCLELLCCCLL
jgi:hypothetical protein